MWLKQRKDLVRKGNRGVLVSIIGFCVLGLLLVACGGSGGTTATSAAAPQANTGGANGYSQPRTSSNDTNTGQKPTSDSTGSNSSQYGPQYLTKSLQVTMQVKDTTQAATALQQWINQEDTKATSDGTTYEKVGNNQYTVTLTFLVDASHYNQISTYLRDYAKQQGGSLLSLHENVQDVTNSYVDAQSTLTNLRAEQKRLLHFMDQAQNMSDVLSIEQQLTQVEGRINDIETTLNALKGEITFYTITISLQPPGIVSSPPSKPDPWSVVPVWQGAWSAVVAIWQVLVSLIVWLAAFSVYIIPLAILFWLLRKRVWQRFPHMATHMPAGHFNEPEPK